MFSRGNLRHRKRLAFGLIPMLNRLTTLSVDIDPVLKQAGIRKIELIDPGFMISFEQELLIAEILFQHASHADASLQLAEHYHLHHFSVLGLAIRSCASLGEIFELILRYPRLVWGVCETDSRVENNAIVFSLHAGDSALERFLLERDMACIKMLFSQVLDEPLQVSAVHFDHKPPDLIQEQEKFETFFQCPVYFGAKTSCMYIPVHELEKKVNTADVLSKQFYEAQCARLAAEIDEPFRYSYLVRDYLNRITPIPPLDMLANDLGIEVRTLQRLLKKEQQSFSQILQEVRAKRAKDYLLYSNLSAEQIAVNLGFSDAAAFSHGFKQWEGSSPRAWLQQNLA